MYTRLTEILFKQKLKETRTICFISEVIAVVGIKHGKKRKDLWKIPQALLPITNLGASPSSPNFTFDFHFYFCFHFLPKISGSSKKPFTHPRALLLLCNIPDQITAVQTLSIISWAEGRMLSRASVELSQGWSNTPSMVRRSSGLTFSSLGRKE